MALIPGAVINGLSRAAKPVGFEKTFMDLQVERNVACCHLAFNVCWATWKLLTAGANGNLRLARKLRPNPDKVRQGPDYSDANHLGTNGQPKLPAPTRLW